MHNIGFLIAQVNADRLYRAGKIEEACLIWSQVAEAMHREGKIDEAKALRERCQHFEAKLGPRSGKR